MSNRSQIDDALHHLLDARDGIEADGVIDPEGLWLSIKYHMAPVADLLACDFRRYQNGAWTLSVYLTERPGPWCEWRPPSDEWHNRWKGHARGRIAEFYAPDRRTLLLAMSGTGPRPCHLEQDALRLIERATEILESGHAINMG